MGAGAMTDPCDLARFVHAQERVYAQVLAELREGAKRSHWMWFIFPQLAGLGSSSTARRYALRDATEARAYLAHPVLGPRLRECTRLVVDARARSVADFFGYPDDLKLRSSLTLFAQAAPEEPSFGAALERWFGGEPDPRTLELLANQG
ncbi:MAG: DUF1810 domain-containing protein [Steroidobacteraceae bacterium]